MTTEEIRAGFAALAEQLALLTSTQPTPTRVLAACLAEQARLTAELLEHIQQQQQPPA